MIKKLNLLFCIAYCLTAQAEVIELKDGTRITGTISSLEKGIYTIDSPSLGTVRINKGEIVKIDSVDSPTTPGKSDISQQALQDKITSNLPIMQNIMAIQNDPDVQAILSDPDIMQAINSGDIDKLMNNEKMKRLMDNPKIKSITDEAQELQ